MTPTQTTKVLQFLGGELASHFRLSAERHRDDEILALCVPIRELARRTPGEHPRKLVTLLDELLAPPVPAEPVPAKKGGRS